MLSYFMLQHQFPTSGWFQCVLSQFYIGLWALWDYYIWEETHTTYTTYNVGVVGGDICANL